MSAGEISMSTPEPSFYHRLNELEKEMHTVRHTLRQIEHERIPQRLTTMETVVPRLAADVASIEKSVDELTRTMTTAVGDIKDETQILKAKIAGWSTALAVIVFIAQMLPDLQGILKWLSN